MLCVPFLPIFTAGLAVVLGVVAIVGKHKDAGMGIAGVLVGGLLVMVAIALMFSMGAAITEASREINKAMTPMPTMEPMR